MRSPRSYLIRALIDWIVDNDWTPHLLIAADAEGVVVPREHVKDERIVLNVSARAVRGFVCSDETVSFDSRFGGREFHVVVPPEAVLAVYARESGAGLAFQGTNVAGSFPSPEGATGAGPGTAGAHPVEQARENPSTRPDSDATPPDRPGGAHPRKQGKPKLTVIE